MFKYLWGLFKKALKPKRPNLPKFLKGFSSFVRIKNLAPTKMRKASWKRGKKGKEQEEPSEPTLKNVLLEEYVKPMLNLYEEIIIKINTVLAKTTTEVDFALDVKEYLEHPKLLNRVSEEELKELKNILESDLAAFGVENIERVKEILRNADEMKKVVMTNAFQNFMENWKVGFYDTFDNEELLEKYGFGSKEELWDKIEQDHDLDWFEETKGKYYNIEF